MMRSRAHSERHEGHCHRTVTRLEIRSPCRARAVFAIGLSILSYAGFQTTKPGDIWPRTWHAIFSPQLSHERRGDHRSPRISRWSLRPITSTGQPGSSLIGSECRSANCLPGPSRVTSRRMATTSFTQIPLNAAASRFERLLVCRLFRTTTSSAADGRSNMCRSGMRYHRILHSRLLEGYRRYLTNAAGQQSGLQQVTGGPVDPTVTEAKSIDISTGQPAA